MKKKFKNHFFQQQLAQSIRGNYDFFLGLLFFLSYRFFFTWLLWRGRGVPPEPDDSYFYLATAKNLLNLESFEDFRLLPFSLLIRFLGLFTGNNLETAYLLNFFIGPVIMFFAFFYFFTKLETERKYRLFLIAILTLYSGSGAYHGFYWVVPSFYQLVLFFIIAGLIIQSKVVSLAKVFLASFGFILVHPTSIFISTVFFIFLALSFFAKRKITIIKNIILFAISIFFSFSIYYLIGKTYSASSSPQSFQSNFSLIGEFLQGKLEPISLEVIIREYFAILFFHPLLTICYFFALILVYLSKQFKLLALYFSVMVIVLVSAFIPYGARTIAFLFPLTFIIIGYAIIQLYNLLLKYAGNAKYLIVIPLVLLLTITTTLNLVSVKSITLKSNYFWDRSCPDKIRGQKVGFYSHEFSHAFILWGLKRQDAIFLTAEKIGDISHRGAFVVVAKKQLESNEKLSKFEKYLTRNITRRTPSATVNFPQNVWTQSSTSQQSVNTKLSEQNLKLTESHDCGYFQVLKVVKL